MIARNPVSGSWQKATCSWVNGPGSEAAGTSAAEDMGDGSALVGVRGDDRTSTLNGGFMWTCAKPPTRRKPRGTVSPVDSGLPEGVGLRPGVQPFISGNVSNSDGIVRARKTVDACRSCGTVSGRPEDGDAMGAGGQAHRHPDPWGSPAVSRE